MAKLSAYYHPFIRPRPPLLTLSGNGAAAEKGARIKHITPMCQYASEEHGGGTLIGRLSFSKAAANERALTKISANFHCHFLNAPTLLCGGSQRRG